MVDTVEKIRSYIAENKLFSQDGFPYPDDTSFLEEGIVDWINRFDFTSFKIHQDIGRAAAKVVADPAVQTIFLFCWDNNYHNLFSFIL